MSSIGVPGCVESISSDRCELAGWVSVGESAPEVVLHVDGLAVARGELGSFRADIAAKTGHLGREFRLRHDPLWPGALSSGSVRVSADGMTMTVARSLKDAETAIRSATVGREDGESHGLSEEVAPAGPGQVSSVPLPVGARCADGSAAVGRDGHLFLLKGSNFLARRYRRPGSPQEERAVEHEVAEWTRIIGERRRRIEEDGARFLQLVVPEKSSALVSGLPELAGVTTVLERLEDRLRDDASYVSGLDVLDPDGTAARSWLRLDTHVSTEGATRLFAALVSRIVPTFELPSVPLGSTASHPGDLSRRFFGVDVGELDRVPSSPDLDDLGSGVTLVESSDPPEGENRWIGLRRVWRNERAPIQKTVVVFGNSYFADATRSARLNWWFTRFFREHHFLWTPWVDHEYVRSVRPDVVVAQTVERFLGGIPEDRG